MRFTAYGMLSPFRSKFTGRSKLGSLHVRRQKDFRVSKEEPALATDALFQERIVLEMHESVLGAVRRWGLRFRLLITRNKTEQVKLSVKC